MSAISHRSNGRPNEALEFRNQSCNHCGKNAEIKLYGSANNPCKPYFKCLDCNKFVMWLNTDHIISGLKMEIPSESDEFSSKEDLIREIHALKEEVPDLIASVKWFVKFVFLIFFATSIIIIVK
ncbi:hypothetical protein RND81_02G030000 [Saponaria officinalis]|uniref:Zinc finger GRF-type domain-containing protein n=1 Tax=Saponaria officinalis TaxID=3572 RepID=A0AAW1MQT8_SAPOF